jgi:hypothetical protein
VDVARTARCIGSVAGYAGANTGVGSLLGSQAGRYLLLRQAMRCSAEERRPTGRRCEEAGVCQQQCGVDV